MALFQNAVLNKYLSGVDDKKVEEAWEKFTAHFHNADVQENIRNSKEEAYQEGFLDDLFVKVLGYTKNPSPDYNLMVEQKNLTDSKKSDGALLDGYKVRGVIELKGTETTDLGKVETQAFGYKNKQPDAIYVIISNFEKLRFYIDNAVDFLEFNLFRLTKEEFKVLWLCLGYSNFAKGLPKKIKDASLAEEENVTKELYDDYSDFKHAVFESMKEHNPEYDKLLLFKKTQKLLDRFLFILFAEDRLLLPPNSIREIIQQWQQLKELDEYRPLYDRFKKYFGYMNEGHKGKKHEIFAYNGGLFAEDEVLDDLKIEDEILYKYTRELSKYDFESEVDVNILGHIFEHSLNEIEEINAELKGEKVDSSKTRRKKDGVFYTPKYITKYIVEHTVGKLCEEKKAGLDIVDERFTEAGRRSQKGISDLKTYREWLLGLTICDPACGSGAFLNQALEFLIAEHKYIDELQARYHGEALVLSDIETQILENNLFGVDINEESVEIAKLSLWLRTAQKGRKLTSLNNNIKCGNSLIDDPEVAGEKAFKWQEEFPDIFRQKDKQAFHVTFVTHNSRTSQRMKDYKVKKGESFRLDDELEVFVTKTIADIVKEDDLNVLAYNICADHVHMILVCEPEELPNIVRKLKGKSAQKLKEHLEIPKEDKFHLWAQKFNRKLIEDDEALYNTWNYIIHNREKHGLPENKKLQEHDEGLPDKELQPDTNTDKGLQPLVSSNSPVSSGESQPLVSASSSPERGEFGFFGMYCSLEYAFRLEYSGGFDVVIGNPPYVKLETIKETSAALEQQGYETFSKRGDLYAIFVEKGFDLLKPKGIYSYIMSNKWLQAGYGKPLREFFLTKELVQLIDFGDLQIFEGATTYPCIFIARNDKPKDEFDVAVLIAAGEADFNTNVRSNLETFATKEFSGDTWVISSKRENELLEKLNNKFVSLEKYVDGNANYGIKFGLTEAFLIDNQTKKELINKDGKSQEIIGEIVRGRDLTRYGMPRKQNLDNIILASFGSYKYLPEKYPAIYEHLLQYEEKLKKRGQCNGSKPTSDKPFPGQHHWLELDNNPSQEYLNLYSKPKIMYQKFQVSPCFIFDEQGLYCNDSMWIIPTDEKSLLGILNSKIGWWLITKYCTQIRGGYQLIWKYFGQIPIPELDGELDDLVDRMLELNNELQSHTDSLTDLLLSKFDIEKLSRKLQSWHELTFKQFLKELKKKKVKLSLDEEAEWMEYFNEQKAEADELKAQISQTDAEIDAMVYELYGLSEEEVEVVEGGIKN